MNTNTYDTMKPYPVMDWALDPLDPLDVREEVKFGEDEAKLLNLSLLRSWSDDFKHIPPLPFDLTAKVSSGSYVLGLLEGEYDVLCAGEEDTPCSSSSSSSSDTVASTLRSSPDHRKSSIDDSVSNTAKPSQQATLTRSYDQHAASSRLDPNYRETCRGVDVLFGRGPSCYRHPGTMRFHAEAQKLQWYYQVAEWKELRGISQHLVDIMHALGGEFLQRCPGGGYMVVDAVKARTKAQQVLRELGQPRAPKKRRRTVSKKYA